MCAEQQHMSKIVASAKPSENRALLGRIFTYLVPYLPVTPTFLVLFVILAVFAVMNGLLDAVLLLNFVTIILEWFSLKKTALA
jgi:hypothetical protein